MDLLEGLSPQLLTTIQAEFAKVDGESAPTPTRQSADVAATASAPGAKGGAGADPLDELFPRVDLGLIVSKTTIVKEAGSDAYKTRIAALETLQALLQAPANKRLKPTIGTIVFDPLFIPLIVTYISLSQVISPQCLSPA